MSNDADINTAADELTLKQMAEIKASLKNESAILGVKDVIAALHNGSVTKIFLANNILDSPKNRITKYASISNIPVEVFKGNSYDLGVICRKPFLVSVLAVKK